MSRYEDIDANELCEMYKNGDEYAFAELYNRYNDTVMNRLHKLVRHDKQEIPDLAQEIWSTAARYIKSSFKGDSQFGTYLYTIVHTRYINYFRYRKPNYSTDQMENAIEHFFYGIQTPYERDTTCEDMGNTWFSGTDTFNTSSSGGLRGACEDNSDLDIAEAIHIHDAAVQYVLSQYEEHIQKIYLCRSDPDKGLGEICEEVGIPEWKVRVISADICKKIDQEIKETFYEYTNRYN